MLVQRLVQKCAQFSRGSKANCDSLWRRGELDTPIIKCRLQADFLDWLPSVTMPCGRHFCNLMSFMTALWCFSDEMMSLQHCRYRTTFTCGCSWGRSLPAMQLYPPTWTRDFRSGWKEKKIHWKNKFMKNVYTSHHHCKSGYIETIGLSFLALKYSYTYRTIGPYDMQHNSSPYNHTLN